MTHLRDRSNGDRTDGRPGRSPAEPGRGRTALVTGAAGFIGFHVSRRLLDDGWSVVGIDNLNDYYDVALKEARLEMLLPRDGFEFRRLDVADREGMEAVFETTRPSHVVHLAAQAGVRHSIKEPHTYVRSNLVGFLNVVEGCRHGEAEHLVYASSSSVYGGNTKLPFSVTDSVDHPVSLYAATKKSDELIAHSYSHLYGLPTTGLRFFTVYGPWGRPDMALFLFTRAILEDEPIQIFNHGDMERDFTYIDDIVEGVVRTLVRPAEPDPDWSSDRPAPGSSDAPFRVYNIGNNAPVQLMDFVEAIEEALGKEAEKELLPMQPGDIRASYADVEALARDVGYRPGTSIREGIRKFVDWYVSYYGEAGSMQVAGEGAA